MSETEASLVCIIFHYVSDLALFLALSLSQPLCPALSVLSQQSVTVKQNLQPHKCHQTKVN